MEGTETLCPHATILNHRWLPGTCSWLLCGKPDEWVHLSPFYTRMHGEWLRYAKSTSQYSLAFSLKVRDDWGFQVNPLCRHDITSPFPPSGNEGYVRNRDVFFCLFYQQFFFFFHTTQHSIQNTTKQNNRHILNISRSNQKGGREGGTTRTQKSLLYTITYIQQKTLPSINGRRPGPTDSRRCTFTHHYLQEATDPICFSTRVV